MRKPQIRPPKCWAEAESGAQDLRIIRRQTHSCLNTVGMGPHPPRARAGRALSDDKQLDCRKSSRFDETMGEMKTLSFALLLLLPLPASGQPLAALFAACTGRYSAEMEHAWLVQDDRAGHYEEKRGQFIELLEAVVPVENRRAALHLRIEAKMAHARLLTQASLSADQDRARWARGRARAEMNYCAGLLLDS